LLSSQISGGYFTVAFDKFSQNIGSVSGFVNEKCFNTSSDLTSLLETGDQIFVDKKVYTVSSRYFTPLKVCVEEPIAASVFSPALARPKTNPVPWDASAQKLKSMLQNTQEFGQVKVERTLEASGYAWTVTFLTRIGDLPKVVVNGLRLVGSPPAMTVSEMLNGIAPDNSQSTFVNASSRSSTYSTVLSGLQSGLIWYFRVTAVDTISNGPYSDTVSLAVGGEPTAPSKISWELNNKSSILLRLLQDSESDDGVITSYNVKAMSDKKRCYEYYFNSF